MNMEDICVRLTDIPDEILLLILKKLNNTDVLYSLIGINIRLDKFVNDPIFTEHLTLMRRSPNDVISSLDDSILERFCSEILPKIHCKIKWFYLEPLCMERILLAAGYPNLYGLSLFNIERGTILRLFCEQTHLVSIFKNNIKTLIITIAKNEITGSTSDIINVMCTYVLSMCTNLLCLKFQAYSDIYVDFSERLFFESIEPARFLSSSLMELHINVEYFTDCLYLLDGRFRRLRTFYVNIRLFTPPSPAIINKEELVRLKCFSLTCGSETLFYEESIVPLLHRMSNLEELFLNLSIGRSAPDQSFIDGNDLKTDIMSHMPKLNKFVFSIHSNLDVDDLTQLPSNENMQRTFKGLEDYQIISYIHYFPDDHTGQCHIYSQPYTMNYLYRLTNSFPGGLFKFVHKVSLFDEHPFEHEFFIRIAQSFPLLTTLSVDNKSPQNHKQCQPLNKDHRSLPVIKYSHLIRLYLDMAHDDYVEQFLTDTKTYLSNYISLSVYYPTLQKVTNNFTRDTTRINCAKVNYIYDIEKKNLPKPFHTYFPCVEEC